MPAIRFWALYGTIARLDAADDLRALAVAGYGANPGKDGAALRGYSADLQRRVSGEGSESMSGAPSVPASALAGPHVRRVDAGEVSGLRARLAAQVAEQKAAYESGGWSELWQVMTRQQAENRNSR